MIDDVKLVKAQREAYVRGASDRDYAVYNGRCSDPVVVLGEPRERMIASVAAARLYPLPTVTVPRVVLAADGFQYRVIGGELQCYEGTNWVPMWFTQADLDAFTDLLANPTETREVTE
jgi:hypothetical protein